MGAELPLEAGGASVADEALLDTTAAEDSFAAADALAREGNEAAAEEDVVMTDGTAETPLEVDPTLYRDEEAAPAASAEGAAAPASSAEDEMPPAAQLRRPATPPRTSSFETHPSSTSSQNTITAGTQAATLSPPRSTFQLTQTELADDSPDPLRIIPTPSAASSAAKSAAARSPSAEPSADALQSSPTRAIHSRQRSKTPSSSHDATGENLDPSAASSSARRGSRAPSASLATAKVRALSALPEAGDSDDELAIGGGAAPPRTAPKSRRSSGATRFDCVEIPVPAHSSAGMMRTTSGSSSRGAAARTSASPAPKRTAPKGKAEGDSDEGKKRGKRGQEFEIVIPVRSTSRSRQTSRSPVGSPRSSPKPSGSGTGSGTVPSPPAQTPSTFPTQPHPHPLSQTHTAIPPSSPLTSLPPSQAERTSPAPQTSPARAKRARRPAAGAAKEEGSTSEPEPEPSSATETASPKKKQRPAPTVKKAAVAARKPASVRGKGKAKAKEPEPEPSSEEEETLPPPSKGRVPAKGRRKSAAKEEEEQDGESAMRAAAADANRGTRRRQSLRATLKEASSSSEEADTSSEEENDDDESDGFVEKKPRASPKKRGRPAKAKAPSSAAGTPRRGRATKSKTAKGKEKARESSPLASSPSKGSFLLPPGSFGSQLRANDRAAVETSEQRAKSWSLNALPRDRPIWAHVRKDGKDCFWWPAQLDCAHWETPLRVKLYLDPESAILEYASETLTFDSPDHDDLVTFRNPTKLRFDKHTFRDATDAPTPPDAIFDRVLETAIEKDAAIDEDDDEDMLLPPSSLGTNGANKVSGKNGNGYAKGKRRAASSEEESSSSEEDKPKEADEDEGWLEGGGEDAGMSFPFYCLAQHKRTWWAARAARYEPPSPSKPGAKPPKFGKFVIEWTDGSMGKVTRKNLLLPADSAFFTVKLGQTELDVPKSYVAKLRAFCSEALPAKFQKIIDEELPLAQDFNDAFFAGGSKRDRLAKKSAFGEMTVESLEEVQDAIDRWASGEMNGGERPTGSERYEALEHSERTQYRVDVLLSIAVVLNYIDDHELAEKAEENLRARGSGLPSEDEVEEEAFKLARSDLELRSATKTVLAMRQSRQIVDASRKQKRQEGRTSSP
ncbi:hypothetical protein JCM10450v2_002025 [Rhodotorula kratochvilovae]